MCSSNELQKSIKKVLMRVSRELQESFKKASSELQKNFTKPSRELQKMFMRASGFRRALRECKSCVRELKTAQESM